MPFDARIVNGTKTRSVSGSYVSQQGHSGQSHASSRVQAQREQYRSPQQASSSAIVSTSRASVVMCGNSEASGASGALMKRGVPSRLTLPVSEWRNALWKQTITSRA